MQAKAAAEEAKKAEAACPDAVETLPYEPNVDDIFEAPITQEETGETDEAKVNGGEGEEEEEIENDDVVEPVLCHESQEDPYPLEEGEEAPGGETQVGHLAKELEEAFALDQPDIEPEGKDSEDEKGETQKTSKGVHKDCFFLINWIFGCDFVVVNLLLLGPPSRHCPAQSTSPKLDGPSGPKVSGPAVCWPCGGRRFVEGGALEWGGIS